MYVLKASDSVFRHNCYNGSADAGDLKLVEDTLFMLAHPHAQQLCS